MQTRTKESKKRLHALILLVAFTAVLLIVSTYAWFTAQKNVSISNIKGKVEVAEGLEISLDANKWTQTLDLDNSKVSLTKVAGTNNDDGTTVVYGKYDGASNVVPEEFLPVSTSGETESGVTNEDPTAANQDRLIMMSGTYDGQVLKDIARCDEDTGDCGYYAFDLFIRNASGAGKTSDILQLNHNSSAWVLPDGSDENDPVYNDGSHDYKGNATYGLQNTVRVAFARYGAADNTDSTTIATDLPASDIITKSNGLKITGVSIWEPNASTHAQNAVANTKLLFDEVYDDGSGSTQSVFLTDISGNKFYTKTLKYAASNNSISNVFDWDNSSFDNYLQYTQTQQTTSENTNRKPMIDQGVQDLTLITTTDGPTKTNEVDKLTIAANSVTKFRIYVWIEGQDPDCVNYASNGGGIEVNIGLAKGLTIGSTSNVEADDTGSDSGEDDSGEEGTDDEVSD